MVAEEGPRKVPMVEPHKVAGGVAAGHKVPVAEEEGRIADVVEQENRIVDVKDDRRHIVDVGDIGLLGVLRRQAVAGEGSLVGVGMGCVMAHRRVVVAVEDILEVGSLAVVEGSLAGGQANGLHIPAGEDSRAEENTEDIGWGEVAGILLLYCIQ